MFKPILLSLLAACAHATASNVIFIHPDGAGVANWQAARFYWADPDAELNWDRIPHIAVYRGHMADSLSATSNGGATSHAYGIKVPSSAFGTDGKSTSRPTAANGEQGSLMHEAMRRGVRTGLVNSGSIIEPGTACFVASPHTVTTTSKSLHRLSNPVWMSFSAVARNGFSLHPKRVAT